MFRRVISLSVVVLVAAIGFLSPQPTRSQDRAGMLQGIVKDAKGSPVAGAFVKLKNAERRLTFMVITQPQGRYSVSSLPSGKYVAQAIGGEFQSEFSAPIDVAAGKSAAESSARCANPTGADLIAVLIEGNELSNCEGRGDTPRYSISH